MERDDRQVAIVLAVFLLLTAAMILYRALESSSLVSPIAVVSAAAGESREVSAESIVSEEMVSRLSLSTATLEDLCQIPKVGPVLAERILRYRDTYGPLSSLEELRSVEGVGEKLYETLCDYLSLD